MKRLLFILLLIPLLTFAQDARLCGIREVGLHRSQSVLSQYQKLHPCPSTGLTIGACPGWALDHVIPLACGGCDAVINLQWLKNTIKSCSGTECKDRWERKINCYPMTLVK